jgi:hypothetical protein
MLVRYSSERNVIRALINYFRHDNDGYDRRGDAVFLANRPPDPEALQVAGIPAASPDQALELVCKAFEIPRRQMYCLRLSDELMDIYRSFNGMRSWDRLEYISLAMGLDRLAGGRVPREEVQQLQTVEDVIRFVSSRGTGGG